MWKIFNSSPYYTGDKEQDVSEDTIEGDKFLNVDYYMLEGNRWENNMKMFSGDENNMLDVFNDLKGELKAIIKLNLEEAMPVFHLNKLLRGEYIPDFMSNLE